MSYLHIVCRCRYTLFGSFVSSRDRYGATSWAVKNERSSSCHHVHAPDHIVYCLLRSNKHKRSTIKSMLNFITMGKPHILFSALPPPAPPPSNGCSFLFLLRRAAWSPWSLEHPPSAPLSPLSRPRPPHLSPLHPLGSSCVNRSEAWHCGACRSRFSLCQSAGRMGLLVPWLCGFSSTSYACSGTRS